MHRSESSSEPASGVGLALVVGTPDRRQLAASSLTAGGLTSLEVDDPYIAMAELCRSPAAVSTLVLSLQSLYREELQLIAAVRRRFPHVDVYLTDLDGRSAALAEAMRLGADGLLTEDGLHRLSERRSVAALSDSTRFSQPDADKAELASGRNGHASAKAVERSEATEGRDPWAAGAPLPERSRSDGEAARSDPRRVGREPRPAVSNRGGGPAPAKPVSSVPMSSVPLASAPMSSVPVASDVAAAPLAGTVDGATLGASAGDDFEDPYSFAPGEPILTAEELRALLHDQPDPTP